MMVLQRKPGERVVIHDRLTPVAVVTFVRERGGSVLIGVEVPPGTDVQPESAVVADPRPGKPAYYSSPKRG